jgi:hypothetical protein
MKHSLTWGKIQEKHQPKLSLTFPAAMIACRVIGWRVMSFYHSASFQRYFYPNGLPMSVHVKLSAT